MPSFPFSPRAALRVAIATALVLGGCATVPERPAEEVVRERAQQRWDALVKGDVEGAYRFLSPGSRQINTLEAYKSSIRRDFWKSAKVNKVTCTGGETCEVEAEVEYEFRRSRFKTPLAETWVKQESNWWYVLR